MITAEFNHYSWVDYSSSLYSRITIAGFKGFTTAVFTSFAAPGVAAAPLLRALLAMELVDLFFEPLLGFFSELGKDASRCTTGRRDLALRQSLRLTKVTQLEGLACLALKPLKLPKLLCKALPMISEGSLSCSCLLLTSIRQC